MSATTITPDMITLYREHLARRGKKQSAADESAEFLGIFADVLAENQNVADAIPLFIGRITPRGMVIVRAAYQFLDDYAKFAAKEHPDLSGAIREGCLRIFENTAKEYVRERKQEILPIPADAVISEKCRGEVTNGQFVTAFGELQRFVMACYDEIEQSPFVWGYPDTYPTDGYYNRVIDILFALVFSGKYQNSALEVDGKKFFACAGVKRHKKAELMVSGFEKMGLKFDSFSKNADKFNVTYPKNPLVLHALNAYVSEIDEKKPHWSYGKPRNGLSYRYAECESAQAHETAFLAEFDYMPPALREIQLWLYAQAAKYGFAIDPDEPKEKGCMLYKKGSKRWLLVGQSQFSWASSKEIYAKAIFRNMHAHEDMAKLYGRFPDTFKSNCRRCNGNKPCTMRIEFTACGMARRCCAYNSFLFENPTLDDVKLILELFKLEYNVK
ncbi:MAG: hypothetical protein LBS21_16190 [Clostridiales bacterium]|jgi:hypothetical protein|nr:hypothetical protein [Clostridiales bacterium]